MVQLCHDLIPLAQAADFKLVFEGRVGWMVDDLLVEMRNTPQRLVIHDADDDLLAGLYQTAAFYVYCTKAKACQLSKLR